MADTADLGSVTVRCGGSSPSMPTRMKRVYNEFSTVDDDET